MQQINKCERCQWPAARRGLNKCIFNLPTSIQVLRPLGGRECGKALTLPLKLVMETWLQRAANGLSLTANQSEETRFLPWWPGGAWAMVGRPAANGAHGCPWRSVKTPPCRRSALKRSADKTQERRDAGLRSWDSRSAMFFRQQTGLKESLPVSSAVPNVRQNRAVQCSASKGRHIRYGNGKVKVRGIFLLFNIRNHKGMVVSGETVATKYCSQTHRPYLTGSTDASVDLNKKLLTNRLHTFFN